jgi:hypothetical protein
MKNLTVEINELKLSADVAESWNEMTADQINHVLMVFDAPVALMGEESIDWRLLQIFKALTMWTDDDLRIWELLSLETYGDDSIFFSDLKILMDAATSFLLSKDEGGYSINPELTRNPYPWVKIFEKGQLKKYYAPHNEATNVLTNVSLDELAQIFTAFENYISENNTDYLFRCCALMYRLPKSRTPQNLERNYDGDIRNPLEDYESGIQKRTQLLKKHLSPMFLRVLEFYIASCRAAISKEYEAIFAPSKGGSTEGGDWIDFILELSDYDVLRKDAVMKQNAHDALETAVRLIKKKKVEGK